MNSKEVGEIRRSLQPEQSTIRHIYGCYVNGNREIISYIDAPLGVISDEEAEQYLSLLKKTLSGGLGKNLLDVTFTTQQVMDSDEHRLLTALRDSRLEDGDAQQKFYDQVIASLNMDSGNYVILLAHGQYDVPYKGSDGETQRDASDSVFSHILCCVCPVKDGKAGLGFFPTENEFHSFAASQTICPPELGFLFPAFDGRAANIYGALAYAKKPELLHEEFLHTVFGMEETPLTAPEQRDAFQSALGESLAEACSMEVVQAVHEELFDRIEQHKESKDPEPLAMSAREVGSILRSCGVEEQTAAAFCEKCAEKFGENAALAPANLIDTKRFEIKTQDVTVTLPPEQSGLVETRVIDGRKYLLIPIESGLEVNGMAVR